jgi:hypothetical protein
LAGESTTKAESLKNCVPLLGILEAQSQLSIRLTERNRAFKFAVQIQDVNLT